MNDEVVKEDVSKLEEEFSLGEVKDEVKTKEEVKKDEKVAF